MSKNIFELRNTEGNHLFEVITSMNINFDKPDAKQLIAYINTTTEDEERKAFIIETVLGATDFFANTNADEIQSMNYTVPKTDILHILDRNKVDLPDFGIPFNAVEQAYKGYDPALDPDIVNPTRDIDLLEWYKDYSPKFVVDPLIFLGGFNIVGAERATGKTRLCLSLAYHMIFGMKEFLGCPMDGHGDVLFVNLEIPESDFKLILEPIRIPFLREGPELHTLYTLNIQENLKLTIEDIENQIARIRPRLVIIDSFKMFMSFLNRNEQKTELNNESVLEIFTLIKGWRKQYNSTVLLTNHTNKGTSGQDGHADLLYGPGALYDYADQVFMLRKAKGDSQLLLKLVKSRYKKEGSIGVNLISISDNPDETEIFLELLEENVDESEYIFRNSSGKSHPPEMILRAQELCAEGRSTRDVGKELGVHHATVARWVKKAS